MNYCPTSHDTCFAVLGIAEGADLDLSANDPGNWTGGAIGVGACTGSRYGISSATYPGVNKRTLTASGACAIYLSDFWLHNRIPELPARIRYLTYSCAVNSGSGMAGRWLQRAIVALGGAPGRVDGNIGDMTIRASIAADLSRLPEALSAQRLFDVSQDAIFDADRMGLSRRILGDLVTATLPMEATP